MKTFLSLGSSGQSDEIVFEYLGASRSRAAIRGAFWSALTTLIPTVLNGLVFIVTSRYLLPRDFGIVALAFSIVSFAAGIGPTAFGEALIQQKIIRQSHLDTVFWLTLLSAIVLYGLLWMLAAPIAGGVRQVSLVPVLQIVALKIFFDMLAIVPNALIARTMSFHMAAARVAIATVVSSFVCVSLITAGLGLWALAIAQIAASAAACVAAFWGAGWLPGLKVKFVSLRELSRYGVFASGNRFLQTMNLDQLIIGTLISPAGLGIYNFARRLFQMISDIVAGGFTSVTHVLLSSLQHDQTKVRDAFLMATFGCSLISFPAFMGLAAVASDAIPLIFGSNWISAIWPVRFFCVIGLMGGIGVIQASLITSQGKSDWWFYYQLFRNLATIAIIFVFYKSGVTVITFALMVQVLLFWPVTLWMVSRLVSLNVMEYLGNFLGPVIAYLGLFAAVFTVSTLSMERSPIWRLSAEVAAGAIAYSSLIFVLCRDKVSIFVEKILKRRER